MSPGEPQSTSEPAGVGRYIVDGAAEAEIAITVVDRFQRRGLGRALFDALAASARAAGIESFHFAIEPWNRTVLRMLPDIEVGHDESEGMLTGRIALAEIPTSGQEPEFVDLLDRCRQSWPDWAELLVGVQLERGGVDAVAKARWVGAVIEQ